MPPRKPAPNKKPAPTKPRRPMPAPAVVLAEPVVVSQADIARDAYRDAVHRRAPRNLPILVSLTADLNALTTSALVGDYDATLTAAVALRDAEKRLADCRTVITTLRALAGAARNAAHE